MSKQDRQGVRHAAELERKYSFGDIAESRKGLDETGVKTSRLEQQLNQYMASTNAVIAELKGRVEAFYPVGSIYISVNATSPADLFGGVWERIRDRFLLAAGSTYDAGATGGEATHELTIDEMPAHSHSIDVLSSRFSTSADGDAYYSPYAGGEVVTGIISSAGGGDAHNNMPPYLAVYVWKRTS